MSALPQNRAPAPDIAPRGPVSLVPPSPSPFQFSVEDAAAYVGMSASWLWASDIPRVRLGRSVKWLREDLEAYLRSHRTHGTQGSAA